MASSIFTSFTLPNGQIIKNRLVKAAMEENLATFEHLPGDELKRLYKSWADGGVGLIITGNVMVDHLAMTGPAGVVLEEDTDLTSFIDLARLSKTNNTKIWMQINHPGRQVFKKMGGKVLSPSNVALNMGKHSAMFCTPKPMDESEIQDVIQRFTITAIRAEQSGFDGVEVHAAHGYLLAQFLSPLTNIRNDKWGGSLENRARLLIQIVKSVKAACNDSFAVAVKLNSADFQRGGFDIDDAELVVKMLGDLNIDCVELSGGSYEAPAMQGRTADGRTLAREAYFLEFASKIANNVSVPIMTTGGVSRYAVAKKVVDSGVELVGMASALALTPDLPNQWQNNTAVFSHTPAVNWKDKTLSGLATMALVKQQLRRISQGKSPKVTASPFWALIIDQVRGVKLTKRYKKHHEDKNL
ncbi:MAG: 2,4-dienoyl-CoA reductase-like NADH-dependent reductase (Old Yellow Enzyme family) [Paraglaciecola sp.]|jgi:2,4-dienoyl-CoA reductase-like NADH-dependent reductase (Old Yellow Enzyme family)|uniref:NADH:flavin oxidoreductase/NADH oxidase family protein n=1 Tax=uncultured Paraglaciecola sp. TaxID=1765024 RepID=UPI002600C49A|nr:NADH:flavin oxidoreductase/NADH oxidase family protein [uncultured Paraglaciecola sp.]